MSTSTPLLDPGIGLVLLAAGSARRFGGDKLSAECGGKRVIDWAMEAAEDAGFVTRMIIVPTNNQSLVAGAPGWQVVDNPAPDEGLASSIRFAVKAGGTAQRLVFALADMPLVEPEHLRALALSEGTVFTAHSAGHAGVPAAFPRGAFRQLLGLKGDRGAAALAGTIDHTMLSPADPLSLIDVDTPAALTEVSDRLAAVRR
ncbi:MAG: nucleotidyltransferase family protein [Sphingomonadaceae bacterium]